MYTSLFQVNYQLIRLPATEDVKLVSFDGQGNCFCPLHPTPVGDNLLFMASSFPESRA